MMEVNRSFDKIEIAISPLHEGFTIVKVRMHVLAFSNHRAAAQ